VFHSLAARIAVEIGADLVIIVSDVDGIYDQGSILQNSISAENFSIHFRP
jgi:aspartokinase-like uncharacterized kinase